MNPEFAAGVFSAARAEFADWSARLWRPLGAITAAVARPAPGERVLDACCGAGASAVPAALAVGPSGTVDAVDVAEGLVEQGRQEAAALGLHQLRFTAADVLSWTGGPYDVVQCCYGVFFFPDMDAGTRHLASLLRPGGRLVVSSWLEGGMARIVPIGRDAALPERPELAEHGERVNASDRVDTPAKVRDWLSSLGLRDITVQQVSFTQPLHPDDAWTLYLGAAMRAFVAGLPPDALERVRARFVAGLAEAGLDTLDASTIVAVAHRD
ncbi:class I SAM-dependent methyltransferase [Prauserella muralis]|uniref:Methylase n=1 Tax=Prauserella muralis TaxID=588067 RepID=A0A2V4AP59_9PSEU|nr:class I SAM-dependent methyltransferase [Prauserella muralis]PXY22367.1 methylase [Prauserella muralis]TWE28023.1 ubiE/COQ5 methyltransferase-like protein [Prauserella muralis]